jgi:hypothetical protein
VGPLLLCWEAYLRCGAAAAAARRRRRGGARRGARAFDACDGRWMAPLPWFGQTESEAKHVFRLWFGGLARMRLVPY